MLFESRLQTIFPLPLKSPGTQQFCEAFSPNAPQIFPGGLQACPLVQVRSFLELGSNSGGVELVAGPSQYTPYVLGCVPGASSFVPPQQASVLSQKDPVIRQPPAGWHTVVPLPRSTQRRVQQLEGPSHGTPSCVQPPEGALQRPGDPLPSALHMPEQQSSVRAQMSPGAWQVYAGTQVPPWQLREQHS
jgi:hypothetical protein